MLGRMIWGDVNRLLGCTIRKLVYCATPASVGRIRLNKFVHCCVAVTLFSLQTSTKQIEVGFKQVQHDRHGSY